MTGGVDKLVLTASLRVDKPKINITFPEKPVLVEVADKIGKTKVTNSQTNKDGNSVPDASISNPDAARDATVKDTAAEVVPAKGIPADDAQAVDEPAQNKDDRDILISEPSVVKTDGLIDEDMLRDMISDIVREELQGDLGEKITRNVRRLVRREIHRTMVSNQLE